MPELIARQRPAVDLDFDIPADEQQVIRVHSKSFALASKVLPADVRGDVCKLYAWCRWCDDAVDEAPSVEVAQQRLQVLRDDIDAIYEGREFKLDASKWFADLAAKYELPKHLPVDLLLGMESDLEFKLLQTEADLELYCYRVAGVVGLMMCRLLGVTNEDAYEHANRLGVAMQMTNIARDVAEDWGRGRYYLPQNWKPLDPQTDQRPAGNDMKPLVSRLLDLAEVNYQLGHQGYASLPASVRLAIRTAAAVYRDIGRSIADADHSVMHFRHVVPTHRKCYLLAHQIYSELRDRVLAKAKAVRTVDQYKNFSFRRNAMNSQFHFLAIFGLSMTLVMATVLFALVGMNPKLESYELAPWIYSGCSAIGAAALWFWAQSIGKRLDDAAVRND